MLSVTSHAHMPMCCIEHAAWRCDCCRLQWPAFGHAMAYTTRCHTGADARACANHTVRPSHSYFYFSYLPLLSTFCLFSTSLCLCLSFSSFIFLSASSSAMAFSYVSALAALSSRQHTASRSGLPAATRSVVLVFPLKFSSRLAAACARLLMRCLTLPLMRQSMLMSIVLPVLQRSRATWHCVCVVRRRGLLSSRRSRATSSRLAASRSPAASSSITLEARLLRYGYGP